MTFLRNGSRGFQVQQLQWFLMQWGYNPGPVDGFCGLQTEQAVSQFQGDRGLTADGVVGPVTWRTLQCQPQVQASYQKYTIREGDTFYTLAQENKISLTSILLANPDINPRQLRIGEEIRIPLAGQNAQIVQGLLSQSDALSDQSAAESGLSRIVGGWIPYWVQAQAFRSLEEQAQDIRVISPFWYHVLDTGEVRDLPNAENKEILEFARARGISVIPLISNEFDSMLISSVLNDPEKRQRNIQEIVDKVAQMDYAGIEINYENLFVADREIFIFFLQELKAQLAAIKKLLLVAAHAKTTSAGDWSGAEAHDYFGIGQNADIVRIMGYEFHSQGSLPGSIAPADWVDQVLAYAVSVIPKAKLELGVPTYGYDWPEGQPAKVLTYEQAIATADRFKASIITDARLGPHYTYEEEGIRHDVWFVDGLFFGTLLDLVNKYDLRGISMWYLGAEDPRIYDVIQARF